MSSPIYCQGSATHPSRSSHPRFQKVTGRPLVGSLAVRRRKEASPSLDDLLDPADNFLRRIAPLMIVSERKPLAGQRIGGLAPVVDDRPALPRLSTALQGTVRHGGRITN